MEFPATSISAGCDPAADRRWPRPKCEVACWLVASPRPKEVAVARSASTEQDQTEHNLITGGADAELASSGPATATVKLPFVQASLSLPPVRARFGGSDGDAGRAAGRSALNG